MELSKERLEFLSDGVFAIAMTLLVLEIKVPDLPRHAGGWEIWHGVAAEGPTFFSFVVTFILAGVFWYWHTVTFHHFRHMDKAMWLLNVFFLMFVSLLPFSTAMLGAFTLRQPATLAIYFGNQLGLGLLLNAQWFYASRRHLIVRQEDDRRLRLFRTQVGLQPVACVLAMARPAVQARLGTQRLRDGAARGETGRATEAPDVSERDDLDALVRELNSAAPGPAPGGDVHTARLLGWLEVAVARSASDLLLVAGAPPSLRIDGRVVPLHEGPLGGDEIEDAVVPALPPHARRVYRDGGIADGSFRVPEIGRFRINLHHERGRAAATIRSLPDARAPARNARTAAVGRGAHAPAARPRAGRRPHGLGQDDDAGGAGGRDQPARGAAHHHDRRPDRVRASAISGVVVEQVEIGVDAPDFPTALRAALRQAPDVIVVGEMRDPETMRIALAAGETGHLVFSSVHTSDVTSTVARIADSFPAERQNTIRQELAMALAAVMTQTLMPRVGGGLVPAAELLMVGYGARQHVRKNALQHLHQEITITRRQGSFTLEESLGELVKQGLVDRKDAMTRAGHPEELERLLA